MARSKGRMSEQFKIMMAREIGVGQQVEKGYFGDVSSRDCGRLVRQAIAHAESILANQGGQGSPVIGRQGTNL